MAQGKPIVLNSKILNTFQLCARKYAIERQFNLRRDHPNRAFSRVFLKSIFNLSSCMAPEAAAGIATQTFMTMARNGFNLPEGSNTFQFAQDCGAMLRCIIEYLGRCPLLTLEQSKPCLLPNGITWEPDVFMDQSGVLHSWRTVTAINQDSMYTHLQSWSTFANMMVFQAPLQLHLVAIGSNASGRRSIPWVKGYVNSVVSSGVRWRKHSGGALHDVFKPVWLADSVDHDVKKWVDGLIEERVIDSLIKHMDVKELDVAHRQKFLDDLEYIGKQIQGLPKELTTIPMSRNACNRPYPCIHQHFCFSAQQDPANSGFYNRL